VEGEHTPCRRDEFAPERLAELRGGLFSFIKFSSVSQIEFSASFALLFFNLSD
jgi:hypothetical protein